jgi:multiple sugar transport system permease protein
MTTAQRSFGAGESREVSRLSRWRNKHRHWIGWLFILPWFIGFIWFDLAPFVLNLLLSFTDFTVGAKMPNWIGLANFKDVFGGDRLIGISFKNTLYYMAFQVPLLIIFAFSLALLLNARIRGRGAYRTIYYLPSLVPAVASSIIWIFMLRTKNGFINQVLGLVGIKAIPWLSRPEWSKPALILMSLWGFGGQMVIYLAGLQGISQELYEAAEIDGATGLQKLIRITIPLMTPTIFFNLIMGIIGSFQVFTQAFIMTQGGPLKSTLFYMLHLYNNAFLYFKMGYASAMAVVLFFIILALTLFVNSTSKRWVYSGS